MKLRLLAAATILSIATAAFASDTFDRTLKVSGQSDLYVSTGSGNIRIHPGNDSEIHVIGHVHAGWSAFGDVGSRVQRIVEAPPIVQDGNSIRIGESNDHSLFNNLSIDYEITAPSSVALNLHSGSGNVRAHGIHGPAELQSGSGDLELEQDGPGDVKVKTGSGSIRVHGFNGGFMARTGSGDIEADGRLTGEANLMSGSGSVRLHLTPDARFNLEASTGSGDIRVHFPGAPQQTDYSRHHLTGSINGGGPALEIRTGSGDVEIDTGGH